MHDTKASPGAHRTIQPRYRERLTPSLKIFAGAAIVAPMLTLVFVRIDPAIALGLGVAAAALLVWLLIALAPVVEVADGRLSAGRAHIELTLLSEPVALAGDDAKRARGQGLDPRGWYLIRGGIEGIVLVENTDADDPVTTWTISSRTPDRLAAAIRRAQRD